MHSEQFRKNAEISLNYSEFSVHKVWKLLYIVGIFRPNGLKIQRFLKIILNLFAFSEISLNNSAISLKTRPKCGQIQIKFQKRFREFFPPGKSSYKNASKFRNFTFIFQNFHNFFKNLKKIEKIQIDA